MFDSILEFAARILAFFYELVPNYMVAIMLMTMLVMVVTTPLTLKGTKGMIKMQLLQPELKKIQEKHKGGDRNEMNQELMAFYSENELNPLGGCLPLLVQAPVFLLLFNVIRGLTRFGDDGTFDPKYLSPDSALFEALDQKKEMVSFGLDLSESTSQALGDSIIHGLPYLALILIMIGAQYLQQKQVSARTPNGAAAMPQQQLLLKVMPAFFGIISINFPAALVIYWVTSSLYRIGLQGYITRSLYGGHDSIGAKANKAAAEARELKEKSGSAKGKPATGKADAAKAGTAKAGTKGPAKATPSNGSNGRGTPGGKHQPSSKKKKRKRR